MAARSCGHRAALRKLRLTLLALCVVLPACGQIGPLYLPGESPPGAPGNDAPAPITAPSDESESGQRDEDEQDTD